MCVCGVCEPFVTSVLLPHSPAYSGYVRSLLGTGRRILPLLVLGLVRLASVKATDYQEHVTEYGVHWNFFFTIAIVRVSSPVWLMAVSTAREPSFSTTCRLHLPYLATPFVHPHSTHIQQPGHVSDQWNTTHLQVLCTALTPLLTLLPLLPHASCAVLLATLHQLYLTLAGGTHYVILGPSGDGSRVGLLSANREGVVSCVGYLVMYMAGIELGKWLFQCRYDCFLLYSL